MGLSQCRHQTSGLDLPVCDLRSAKAVGKYGGTHEMARLSTPHDQNNHDRVCVCQARKRHIIDININCFVRLVPVFHRICPRDKPSLSLGQMKNWDKPRNSPYSTQWKPFVPGICPWDKPGVSLGQSRGRRAAQKVYVNKNLCAFFARLRFKKSLAIAAAMPWRT